MSDLHVCPNCGGNHGPASCATTMALSPVYTERVGCPECAGKSQRIIELLARDYVQGQAFAAALARAEEAETTLRLLDSQAAPQIAALRERAVKAEAESAERAGAYAAANRALARLARVRTQRDRLAEMWRCACDCADAYGETTAAWQAECESLKTRLRVEQHALVGAFAECDRLRALSESFRGELGIAERARTAANTERDIARARLATVTAAAEKMQTQACLGCNADDCDDCHFGPFVAALREAVKS